MKPRARARDWTDSLRRFETAAGCTGEAGGGASGERATRGGSNGGREREETETHQLCFSPGAQLFSLVTGIYFAPSAP